MSPLNAYLATEDILLHMEAGNKKVLFEAIGRHMEKVHGIPGESVAAALQRRELAASTALGCGVAIPHARVIGLNEIRMLYVRPVPPMASYAADGRPISDVVVLLVPAPAVQEHLDVLAHVVALFSDDEFRRALHICQSPYEVRQLFKN